MGNEPAKDWLDGKDLDDDDREKMRNKIAVAEEGWPIGLPICRNLGQELYEVRVSLKDNRIARMFVSPQSGRMVMLHGFIKKSTTGRKTPPQEIATARTRLDDLKKRVEQLSRAGRRRTA